MGNSMAEILKNVIRNGGLPLSQVSERIETMYLDGRIDGKERMELTELMHEKADPQNEAGGWQRMYGALAEKYEELAARVMAAEKALGLYQEPEGDEGYPEWEMWDGVNGGYEYGQIVIHNGKRWQNMLQGTKNVWEPGAMGVDERYWKEVGGEGEAQ